MATSEAEEVFERQGVALCWDTIFCGCSSPVVVCTYPQTRNGISPITEQSFGMYSIHMHGIASIRVVCDEQEKKKEYRPQSRWTKMKFSHLLFS